MLMLLEKAIEFQELLAQSLLKSVFHCDAFLCFYLAENSKRFFFLIFCGILFFSPKTTVSGT